MSDVSSGIESVWGYKDGAWQIYIPGYPEMSNLQNMKKGHGYWVKTNQKGLSIQIKGQLKTTSIALTPGWHLIGFNSLQGMPVEDALADVEGEIESIWGYKNGVWQVYDPQNPGFNDLEKIEPKRGYWIKIRQ